MTDSAEPLCALCHRTIPPDARQSVHHLIPKLKGGRGGPTVLLHHMCHNEIHATLTEAELAQNFDTPEKLREHPHLAGFIKWLSRKPPSFHAGTQKSLRRRKR